MLLRVRRWKRPACGPPPRLGVPAGKRWGRPEAVGEEDHGDRIEIDGVLRLEVVQSVGYTTDCRHGLTKGTCGVHFGTAAKPHPRSKDISLLHYSVLADTIIRHHTIEGEFSRNLALWHAPDLPRRWQLLAPNDDSLCGWTKEGLFSRYCPVLVEKSQGGPLGRWMHLLCGNRAAYRRGLLIQSFGVE